MVLGRRRAARGARLAALVAAVLTPVCAGWFGILGAHPLTVTITGAPRAADTAGRTDADQIRDVLQSISDAYNDEDVRAAEEHLCPRSRAQWSPALEKVWMGYRMRHGSFSFTITSVEVTGEVAHVTGTQTYARDPEPRAFAAEMGRVSHEWKMCSSG